jgi:flagellar assembly protein FliH
MSNMGTPKEQQTAYQRWEMSSFAQANVKESSNFNHSKRKEAAVAPSKIAEIFESVRQEAFNKGMQEGFAVGMAKAKESALKDRQNFSGMAAAFADALKTADEKIEEDILGLALDIAKAMLKAKLKVDPEAILPVVRDAIHYLPHVQKPARIFVHHEDAKILREQMSEELSEQVWQIQEDNNIERGGCMVETGANQIDATNATRWKRIGDALAQSNDWLLP